MGSVGTLASAAGRPGRAQEGTEGGSVRPLFQHFHAPSQTRVALEETHLMVQGRCSSPPLPAVWNKASQFCGPACLLPCLPLPASPRAPRPIHSASLEFTEQPALESISSELGSAWLLSELGSAWPALRAVWLWAACGGDRRAGWQDPAPRPRPRVSCGTLACPDREDSSPALDPLFSPRCPSLSGSPEAPHSGVKGLPEKLVLDVSKCSSVLWAGSSDVTVPPLPLCL